MRRSSLISHCSMPTFVMLLFFNGRMNISNKNEVFETSKAELISIKLFSTVSRFINLLKVIKCSIIYLILHFAVKSMFHFVMDNVKIIPYNFPLWYVYKLHGLKDYFPLKQKDGSLMQVMHAFRWLIFMFAYWVKQLLTLAFLPSFAFYGSNIWKNFIIAFRISSWPSRHTL